MIEDRKDPVAEAKPSDEQMDDRTSSAQRAIAVLDEWLADESGYDEGVWPLVKKGLEENRLSDRSRLRG